MEQNHRVFQPALGKLAEEFSVASLFWDLVDDVNIAQDNDNVAIDRVTLFGIIGDTPLADMGDVYVRLVAELVVPGDVARSDLDDIFVNHGFFTDDGDGVFDDFEGTADACPTEDASGFDVDEDGCIDSFVGLTDLVQTLVDEEVISTQMLNSLLSKVDNAYSSTGRDQVCIAVNQLEAFVGQVNGQTGKKISAEAATQVIDYAQSLVAYLTVGESC